MDTGGLNYIPVVPSVPHHNNNASLIPMDLLQVALETGKVKTNTNVHACTRNILTGKV